MNDDFEIDDRHEIDDLFRNALHDYTERPSDELWKKMNRRLNRKEAADFITFRKTPGLQEKNTLPLYRQQWVRIAAAACVSLLVLFVSAAIINRVNQNTENPKGYFAQHNTKVAPQPAIDNNSGTSVEFWNQVISENPLIPSDNNVVADRNDQINRIPFLPEKTDITIPWNSNSLYADNNRKPVQNIRKNNKSDNSDQNNAPENVNRKEFIPNNNNFGTDQSPVLADNGNNSNNPVTDFNVRIQHPDSQAAYVQAMRFIDSLIRADAIKEVPNPMQVGKDQNDKDINKGADNNASNENNLTQKVIPHNVITPNGDGFNDKFVIENIENYPDNTLMIIDRNGKTIYQMKGYTNQWDAANTADGTYYYFLTYQDSENKTVILKDQVYITRGR